jgi:aquaporin Z
VRSYLAELLGAFFLVFAVLCCAPVSAALTAVCVATVLVVCVWVGAHVSGGHFNPAVTLGVYLSGGMSSLDLLSYWAAQLAGALLAAVVAMTVLPSDASRVAADASTLAPVTVVELLFSFALVYVVLSVGASRRQELNVFLGVACGVVVLAGMLAVSALSTGAFNPAIAFGLGVDGDAGWPTSAVHVAAELVGGAAAAAFVRRTQRLVLDDRGGARDQ